MLPRLRWNADQRARWLSGADAWLRPTLAAIEGTLSAGAGDSRAMLALGWLYLQGLGVLQDYVQAHKWFNLAASRGESDAARQRDALAAKMTAEERAEARKLAREWRPGGGQGEVAADTVRTIPAAAPPPVQDSDAPPLRAIREAQQLLARLGYEPGPVDGTWNRRTGRAYHAFLRDTGLPAAEMLTPIALRAMRAVVKRSGGGPVSSRAAAVAPEAARTLPEASPVPPAPVRPDALHRAAQEGDIDGLKAALDAGVDPNAPDARGWTALMHAANKGYTLLVDSLLGAGADTDLRAADSATVLFIAALHGHAEIVAALIRAGADASVRGPKGMTPLEVAQERGHTKILELPEVVALREAEARRVEAQHAKEDSDAFARARSSNSVQALAAYRSAWCPDGSHCEEARTRIDELTRAKVEDKAFSGVNSLGDRQIYEFLPSGEMDGVSRPSSWTRGWCSGTWKVEEGKIQAKCVWASGVG